jgi:hypothetical protein
MVVHGIHIHVNSSRHHLHSSYEKIIIEEQSNTLTTEQNVLMMITFYAEKRSVD